MLVEIWTVFRNRAVLNLTSREPLNSQGAVSRWPRGGVGMPGDVGRPGGGVWELGGVWVPK